MKRVTRTTILLLVLLGSSVAISPPAPVAANEDGCSIQNPGACVPGGSPIPNPCNMVTLCDGVTVPDPCARAADACGCVGYESVNVRGGRICGFPTNPCALVEGFDACGCVGVPSAVSIGGARQPLPSGSCGVTAPAPPDSVPNPCDGLAEDACGCVSVHSILSGVQVAAIPDTICNVPINPCGLVGDGAVDDGCGCVEMGGPQRDNILSAFAGAAVLPTLVCGVPTDPCGLFLEACECSAYVGLENVRVGSGTTPTIGRAVATPALCVPADPCAIAELATLCCVVNLTQNAHGADTIERVRNLMESGNPLSPCVADPVVFANPSIDAATPGVHACTGSYRTIVSGTVGGSTSGGAGVGPFSMKAEVSASITVNLVESYNFACDHAMFVQAHGRDGLLRRVRIETWKYWNYLQSAPGAWREEQVLPDPTPSCQYNGITESACATQQAVFIRDQFSGSGVAGTAGGQSWSKPTRVNVCPPRVTAFGVPGHTTDHYFERAVGDNYQGALWSIQDDRSWSCQDFGIHYN